MRTPDLEIKVYINQRQAMQALKALRKEMRNVNAANKTSATATKKTTRATDGYRRAIKRTRQEQFKFRIVTAATRRTIGAIRNELLLISFTLALVATGFTRFVGSFTGAFAELQKATRGLEAVAGAMGQIPAQAAAAAQGVVAMTGGLVNIAQASLAMKQGLVMGGTIQETTDLIMALADSAVYNAQGMYTAGEAITVTMQGIKNFMSVTADAAGVTKNLSVMLKEWERQTGRSAEALGDFEKYGILFKAFQKEASVFRGNLEQFLKTFAGLTQKLKTEFKMLQAELGAKMIPAVMKLYAGVSQMIAAVREHNQLWTNFIGLAIESTLRDIGDALGFVARNLVLVQSAMEAIAVLIGYGLAAKLAKGIWGVVQNLRLWHTYGVAAAATSGQLLHKSGALGKAIMFLGRALGMVKVGFLGTLSGIGLMAFAVTDLISTLRRAIPLVREVREERRLEREEQERAERTRLIGAGPPRAMDYMGAGGGLDAWKRDKAAYDEAMLLHLRATREAESEHISGLLGGGGIPASIALAESQRAAMEGHLRSINKVVPALSEFGSAAGRTSGKLNSLRDALVKLNNQISEGKRADLAQRLKDLSKATRESLGFAGIGPHTFAAVRKVFEDEFKWRKNNWRDLRLTEEEELGLSLQMFQTFAKEIERQSKQMAPFLSPGEAYGAWVDMVGQMAEFADTLRSDASPAMSAFLDSWLAGLMKVEGLIRDIKERQDSITEPLGPSEPPIPIGHTIPIGDAAMGDTGKLTGTLGWLEDVGYGLPDMGAYTESWTESWAYMRDSAVSIVDEMTHNMTSIFEAFWTNKISLDEAGWLATESAMRAGAAGALEVVSEAMTAELRALAKGYAVKGAAKIAESIWPPNPAALASGLGLLAAATAAGGAAGLVSGIMRGGATAIRTRGQESFEHYMPESDQDRRRRSQREGGADRTRFGAVSARQESVDVTISISISGDTVIVGPGGIEEAGKAMEETIHGIVQAGITSNRYDFGRMANR